MRKSSQPPVGGPGGLTASPSRFEPGEAVRANLYDEVTGRIIAEMEAGRVPWVQPWGRVPNSDPALPHNASTGARYSGINILILWGAGIAGGYRAQSWLTFRQAQKLGGAVKKGEHGTAVFYADRFIPQAEKDRAARGGHAPHAIPFLKRFTVFNVAQFQGLPEGEAAAPLPERAPIPEAEALIAAAGARIRIGGDKAFYAPGPDFIQVPPHQAFPNRVDYYATCLHELSHWTGHRARLNREMKGVHGSPSYAREELVAEMGSAFTCAALGITPTVRHADYLASWLDVLREDNHAIFRAASQASKAADFLLAFRPEPEAQARALADERRAAA